MTSAGHTGGDPVAPPALGESRARVLEALQWADDPVAISDVAAEVGLHPNTARFHLDALVEHGLATRATENRRRSGRPRALYTATGDARSAGRRSYRLLAEAVRRLVATVDDVGFAPVAVADDGHRQLLLRHCPFREVAEEPRDVVCTIHLGLMRGVLAELDAPLAATRLEPFVEPDVCVADLAIRPVR